MGWKAKALAVLLGLVLLGAGLWPFSLLCFAYVLFAGRSRSGRKEARKPHARGLFSTRLIVGLSFILLAAVAAGAGGTFSPLFFFALGATILAWSRLHLGLPAGAVRPLADSVLLRSRYLPFLWSAVAELKPGTDSYPRAVSSFEGRLAVFTEPGKAYLIARCNALGPREAEMKLLTLFRSAISSGNSGAYLLPLEASAAAGVFGFKLSPLRITEGSDADLTPPGPCMLLLDCSRGFVRRAAAFAVGATSSSSTIPSRTSELESAPLTWEVLESLGRKASWPDPDAVSNLLDSFVATRGVHLGERLKSLEGAGSGLKVESLAGEKVSLSRPQLRAIVSIYT